MPHPFQARFLWCIKQSWSSESIEDGSVTWQMREVAILACPAVKHQVGTSSAEMAVLKQPEWGTTNGKRIKFSKNVRDQPLTDVKSIDEERGLPLDKTS